MLTTKPVTWSLPEYKEIVGMMDTEFPEYERIPVWLLHVASWRRDVDLTAYYDEDAFVGFTFSAAAEKMAFLLFIAVNPKIQSKGYGSQILAMLCEKYKGKDVALNMEAVDETAENYKQRLKRLQFYQKNGFHETGYTLGDDSCVYSFLNRWEHFDLSEFARVTKRMLFGITSLRLSKKSEVEYLYTNIR